MLGVPGLSFEASFRHFFDRLLVHVELFALNVSGSLRDQDRGAHWFLRRIPANDHFVSDRNLPGVGQGLLRPVCTQRTSSLVLPAIYNEEISDSCPNDRELSSMAWRIRSIEASESPTYCRQNFRQRPLHGGP